jgi:2'-5' RNA ligase superfamily
MVAAIELYFEPVVERRLRTLWTALEAAGVPTLANHTHRRHRPHLSLAVADEFSPEAVAGALGVLPLGLPLTFQHAGQFPGGVLWLGPAPTADLLTLHRETVARLDAAGIPFWPLYRPDVWVPHCTLSMTARREAVAKAVPLCFDILPLPTYLISAAVVDHSRGLMRPLPVTSAVRA